MKAISKENKATTFYLYEKAKNKSKIRVLYKQNGKSPRVRIIPNVQVLKRAIINRKLDIIPYQNVFLICNNQNYMKNTPINVVFDFFHISGDLLIVQKCHRRIIDKNIFLKSKKQLQKIMIAILKLIYFKN